jgi:hypothetical protein
MEISDLASGQVVKVELNRLVKNTTLGRIMALQFSHDMKYVCFCTTTNLFIFSLEKMKLEKQIEERVGFIAATSLSDGSIIAVAPNGKIVQLSSDLSSVTEKKIEEYFDVYHLDPGGRQIILADTEARNAQIFDIQQNKVITTIVGE